MFFNKEFLWNVVYYKGLSVRDIKSELYFLKLSFMLHMGHLFTQGFGRGKDVNYRKFIGSNIVIFCYKEFKKLALCKSVSQLETTFNVYSEPVKSSHVKISFS